MRAREVLLAVVCAALSACGGGGGVGRSVTTESVSPPLSRPRPPADAAALRALARPGTLLARAHAPALAVHWEPGTARPFMRLDATNPWRQALRLLVLDDALDADGDLWLRVQLPIWPNGQEGWVAATDVGLGRAPERIVVDLSDRRLARYRDGEAVTRLRIGIGAPDTPTPTGRYVVWAKVHTGRPSGPYGSYILGLSGFSETIQPDEWPGEPRLAIHGTADPDDAGRAVSSGCVRVPNALLPLLRDVPMGTPVTIRS
ncbi:MAG TPA: L,D-transpeptidase [Actinomycetota bacterium]|nr:L,D-transpeptidase [Actinomycetota bacterium]